MSNYEQKPLLNESSPCEGCVGDGDVAKCLSLPVGCRTKKIIWVQKPPGSNRATNELVQFCLSNSISMQDLSAACPNLIRMLRNA